MRFPGKGKGKGSDSDKDSDDDTGSDSDASDYDSDEDAGSEDEDNREFVQKDVEQRDFQVLCRAVPPCCSAVLCPAVVTVQCCTGPCSIWDAHPSHSNSGYEWREK